MATSLEPGFSEGFQFGQKLKEPQDMNRLVRLAPVSRFYTGVIAGIEHAEFPDRLEENTARVTQIDNFLSASLTGIDEPGQLVAPRTENVSGLVTNAERVAEWYPYTDATPSLTANIVRAKELLGAPSANTFN